MCCRQEILTVIHDLVRDRPGRDFTVAEVLKAMNARGSVYSTKTIATYLSSTMCWNVGRSAKYLDLERLARGRYRVR